MTGTRWLGGGLVPPRRAGCAVAGGGGSFVELRFAPASRPLREVMGQAPPYQRYFGHAGTGRWVRIARASRLSEFFESRELTTEANHGEGRARLTERIVRLG